MTRTEFASILDEARLRADRFRALRDATQAIAPDVPAARVTATHPDLAELDSTRREAIVRRCLALTFVV